MNAVLACAVIALPFLAALAVPVSGHRWPRLTRALAVAPTLVAAALAGWIATAGPARSESLHRLLEVGPVRLHAGTSVDPLAAAVAVMVCVVAVLVQVYSVGYLASDRRYPSYAALVSLFTAAMLLVVYAADLVVLLVGWEVMGACSYFLIGHHWELPEARRAAVKSFLVTRLGDIPFLLGIFVLGADAGSFRIADVVEAAATGRLEHAWVAALLLLGGVAGKSAQLPLHTWLPDAMAGPTPVSALIHAATMVAAGVYLVARVYPVFLAAPSALDVLAVSAALTMLGAALFALAQDDLKRILAWSTVSQLAYMTAGLAVGSRSAAVFHLLSHAAFKALLFLAAGTLIHALATNSTAAMGGARRTLPTTFWTMSIGLAALVGLPPFAGFFSKESVLAAAEHAALADGPGSHWAGWLVLVSALVTAAVTAAYATRLWLRVFFGTARGARDQPVPVPAVMRWPLLVLAVPSALLGLAALRSGWLPSWLGEPTVDLTPEATTAVLAGTAILLGFLPVYLRWRRDPAADPVSASGPLAEGLRIDTLYRSAVTAPVQALARVVRFVDDEVVDAYVRGTGRGARLLGGLLRRSQTGNVQTYLAVLVSGVVLLALTVAATSLAGAVTP